MTDLRAGALTMVFDCGDLRFIRLGDREISRRIFVALRDRNWGTPQGSVSDVRIQSHGDSVPDQDHTSVTSGYGTYKEGDYVPRRAPTMGVSSWLMFLPPEPPRALLRLT